MQAILLALFFLSAFATAQNIVLWGDIGCLSSIEPWGPANLWAQAGDSEVQLTWDKPANGACVDEYQVRLETLGGGSRSLTPQANQTTEYNVVVSYLRNFQPYKFIVRAYSWKFNGGGEAAIEATPRPPSATATLIPPGNRCIDSYPPSPPSNLTATQGVRKVILCYEAPANFGCADEYRVSVPNVQEEQGAVAPFAVTKTGCIPVDNLKPGVNYTFAVQSWSKRWASSPADFGTARVEAAPLEAAPTPTAEPAGASKE